jgi:TetR/AcrR family transcriptional regulator, tetracycline repressor protein
LALELKIQAPTLYWHFKSKEDLIDEMATMVLADGTPALLPGKRSADWKEWAAAFGMGLRQTLLRYRDGARMVAGTRLTNTIYMETAEQIAAHIVSTGFTVRETVVLLSTIYGYTLSFVTEEQAVFPKPGERSLQYDIEKRNARLDPARFPLLRKSGKILFDQFDRRFKEGLGLILEGAAKGRIGGWIVGWSLRNDSWVTNSCQNVSVLTLGKGIKGHSYPDRPIFLRSRRRILLPHEFEAIIMGKRVLVADDHKMVREMVGSSFKAQGFDVCQAVNGQDALQKAQEEHPDLIVLDLAMPVMNGLEAARALHLMMPRVPLVMFTNTVGSYVEQEARSTGISKVISKSEFESVDRLIATANRLLAQVWIGIK